MKIYQVDSFTDQPFKGNPAGVCLLDKPLDDETMRSIAMEMNLSETAFLLPRGKEWSLRWFTPKVEVDLCGHATLAAAHILFTENLNQGIANLQFQTRSGLLQVKEVESRCYTMDFPVSDVEPEVCPDVLIQALGETPVKCFANEKRFLLEYEREDQIQRMKPNFSMLENFPRGIMVTAPADNSRLDFVSRFFASYVGINEDPVTGSAHCYLAPYWGEKLGKVEMKARQLSDRAGEMTCRLTENRRVELTGQAVTVFKGQWLGRI